MHALRSFLRISLLTLLSGYLSGCGHTGPLKRPPHKAEPHPTTATIHTAPQP